MNTLTQDEWLEWMKDKSSAFAFCIPAYKSVDSDGNTEYTIDKRHLQMWSGFDVTAFIVRRMNEFTVDGILFTPVVLQVSFDELSTRSRDTQSAEVR